MSPKAGAGHLEGRPDRPKGRLVASASDPVGGTPSGRKRGGGGCEVGQDCVRDDLLYKIYLISQKALSIC